MNWILIYIVAQTIGTAGFTDKETCQGRVSILHDQKIEAKCVEAPTFNYSNGIIYGAPNLTCTGNVCR